MTVERNKFTGGDSDHIGSTGLVFEESKFSKEVSHFVRHHLLNRVGTLQVFGGYGIAFNQEVHFLCPVLAFLNYHFLGLEGDRLEGVGHPRALVGLHRLEQGHLHQERLVLRALAVRSFLDYVVEAVAIQTPQLAVLVGCDRGLARRVVK